MREMLQPTTVMRNWGGRWELQHLKSTQLQ